MAIILFILDNSETKFQCCNNENMKEICEKFLRNKKLEFDEVVFLYRKKKIDETFTFNQQIK